MRIWEKCEKWFLEKWFLTPFPPPFVIEGGEWCQDRMRIWEKCEKWFLEKWFLTPFPPPFPPDHFLLPKCGRQRRDGNCSPSGAI
jgi:hypothetical protein